MRYMEMKDVPFIRYRTFSFIRLILQTASSQSSPVMKKKCSIISIKWISAKRLAPFSMCCCESMLQCEPSKYTIYLLSTPLRHLIRLLFIYSCIYVLFIYQALQNPKVYVYPQIHLDITANTSETRNVYLVKERKVTNENG